MFRSLGRATIPNQRCKGRASFAVCASLPPRLGQGVIAPYWPTSKRLLLSSLIGAGVALLVGTPSAGIQVGSRAPPNRFIARGRSIMQGMGLAQNRSQDDLVRQLVAEHRLRNGRVAEAMQHVDRRHFIDTDEMPEEAAYMDTPLPIGYGETISAPHMHATAADLLEQSVQPGAHVLDVGSGSGYLTGVFGLLAGDTGQVLGVEKHRELAERSQKSLQAALPDLTAKGTVRIIAGNVLGKVLEEYGPFDAIHVGAAAATMPQVPKPKQRLSWPPLRRSHRASDALQNLIDKLKPGGRMVIPVGAQDGPYQVLQLVDKHEDGTTDTQDLMAVRYVPLTKPGMDPYVGKDEM